MTWTTEKPSKPGWYWYRSPTDRVQIIELVEWNNELRAVGVSPDMHLHLETHRMPHASDAEWAGPLPPPEEKHSGPPS
jgi:hypothetical protein